MARWTTKALSRKGYRISPGAPLELFVDEDNRCWTIHDGESTVVTHSIEEALQKIADLYVER